MIISDDTEEATSSEGAAVPAGRRRGRFALLAVAALLLGLAARSLVTEGADSVLVRWLPWLQRTPATIYFADASGAGLVPVARTLDRDATVADLMQELAAGPAPGVGLAPVLPAGFTPEAVTLEGGVVTVTGRGDPAAWSDPTAVEAVRQTFLAWEGVTSVRLVVSGTLLDLTGSSGHLLFFYDEGRDMLVAHPTPLTEPRDVIAAFLAGPEVPVEVALPGDVELLAFDYSSDSGLLSLNFTYRPSVRSFALDHPNAMRRVLEGLIATMTTGFPQIEGVYLDFEGHATLGLGQCADLLRSLQLRPEVLNDERLLARAS